MLTDEELLDFLRRCNYNTLSYFKVSLLFQTQGLLHYYMIWIAPIERSTNKSNDQGSNNNISSIQSRLESAIKPESEMTLEEFF